MSVTGDYLIFVRHPVNGGLSERVNSTLSRRGSFWVADSAKKGLIENRGLSRCRRRSYCG
jgi:hypothetical protein